MAPALYTLPRYVTAGQPDPATRLRRPLDRAIPMRVAAHHYTRQGGLGPLSVKCLTSWNWAASGHQEALPLAWLAATSITSPVRFSIITCPARRSRVSFPRPFRASRTSGSVVDRCVALHRRSHRQSTSGFLPTPPGSHPHRPLPARSSSRPRPPAECRPPIRQRHRGRPIGPPSIVHTATRTQAKVLRRSSARTGREPLERPPCQ